jgi:hypothetical protein
MMRQHWMAIPIAAVSPFIVAAFVLSETEHWSDGALGTVLLGLMGIACVVGTFMVPLDAEGNLEHKPRRPHRHR